MLTPEQAQLLIAEGAQTYLRDSEVSVDRLTFLEFAIKISNQADAAQRSDLSADQWKYFMRVAGLALLALQYHGDALYTTYKLQRSLHPQQAAQRSLLMEQQFLRSEIKDAFTACWDDAKMSENYDAEQWTKLWGGLQKLGVGV